MRNESAVEAFEARRRCDRGEAGGDEAVPREWNEEAVGDLRRPHWIRSAVFTCNEGKVSARAHLLWSVTERDSASDNSPSMSSPRASILEALTEGARVPVERTAMGEVRLPADEVDRSDGGRRAGVDVDPPGAAGDDEDDVAEGCLLYTSPSPRDS